jgi:hypothetical protein
MTTIIHTSRYISVLCGSFIPEFRIISLILVFKVGPDWPIPLGFDIELTRGLDRELTRQRGELAKEKERKEKEEKEKEEKENLVIKGAVLEFEKAESSLREMKDEQGQFFAELMDLGFKISIANIRKLRRKPAAFREMVLRHGIRHSSIIRLDLSSINLGGNGVGKALAEV